MTSDPPLISCIVPAFNAGRYLRESLASITNQSYAPIEIVVADGGSDDDSLDIARSHGDGVRIVAERGLAPAATRNLGASAARGAFLAFLDADDLWHPDKLERQMRCFHDDRGLDLCVTHVQMFWDAAVADEGRRLQSHARATEPVPGFSTITLLVRRTAFERVGPFDPELWHADAVDWFIRAEMAGLRRHLLPDVLTYHRMHKSNLTRRRDRNCRDEFLRVVKAWTDRRQPAKASDSDSQSRLLEESSGDMRPEGARSHPPPARPAEAGPQSLVGDQT
jgi:glycosyltransferase involved in cell wall biosynthesis